MIDNHNSIYFPPGVSAVEQILADLSTKRLKEQEKRFELETLLAESRTRENNLDITINSLRSEYGVADEVVQEMEKDKELVQPQDEEVQLKAPEKNLASTVTHPPVKSNWKKPKNKSWLELVREAIRHYNRFVTLQEIITYLGMNEKAQEDNYNTITSTLAAYRASGHIIGFTAYKKTITGKTTTRILSGLPEFLINIDGNQLKQEYDDRLKETLSQLEHHRSVEEAKLA